MRHWRTCHSCRPSNNANSGRKGSCTTSSTGNGTPTNLAVINTVSVSVAAGNVGNAPFFLPPASWLMAWRSRRLQAMAGAAATQHGALHVNLFRETADDPFVQQPHMNAADGLHPADAGYRVWFDELVAQAGLSQHLSAARSNLP